MLSFWQHVWNRRAEWTAQRKHILTALVNKVQQLTTTLDGKVLQTPYVTCLKEMEKIIQHHRVYMYCSQDTHLHAIKFYLTDFAFSKIKNCRGVTVKATSDSTLTMLCLPGFTIINLHTYFDCKTDSEFFNVANMLEQPKPGDIFISHQQKNLFKHHCTFIQDKPKTLHMYCKQRGKELSAYILNYWTEFGIQLWINFNYDIHGQSLYPSASFLSFSCLWAAYAKKAGPMCHAIEKTKKHYEKLLRDISKGGFMFSVEGALEQNEPFNDDPSLLAQSITEMDLVSAYGYSASKAYMPTGFSTGFRGLNTNDTQNIHLEKLDTSLRHRSFEFRAVYQTIHDMMQRQDIQIRTVYSNFSPFGLFYVGPYPIDLVITTSSGLVFLYQMDGAWCHGCATCPPLTRYINKKTWHQVRMSTEKRNDQTQRWVQALNATMHNIAQPFVSYQVIQDCCTPSYTPKALDIAFQVTPALTSLVQGYQITDMCGKFPTWTQLEQWMTHHTQSNYTFIAHVDLIIDPPPFSQAPLVTYQPRENKYAKTALSYQGQVVLTRDYYKWLTQTFGGRLCINAIDWIIFYAAEPCWNYIFNQLTVQRSCTQDQVLVSFLKRTINLGCGFFGARMSQIDKCTYRLVHGMPANYTFFLHRPDLNYSMDIGNNSYFVLETKIKPRFNPVPKANNSPLAMFVCIIEYGKLRLVQIMHFIQQHVRPNYFKLLYSNVDNILFALANVDTLEEAVRPDALASFEANKPFYFVSDSKQPGLAKLEWIRNGPCQWKFITLRTQHYCLILSEQAHEGNLHKTAGWKGLSSWKAYASSKAILDGQQVCMLQDRRINKIANLMTCPIKLKY
jgi:hypothetical protein